MSDNLLKFPLAFEPEKDPILYHYCSTETFLSIISRKCVWMSDINTMNDFGEVHWAYDQFVKAANVVIDRVGKEFLDAVDEIVHSAQLRILPMLCAFSTNGDVLSQWRAYSDDGAGVAIGFDAEKIASLSVRIAQIDYNSVNQISYFSAALLALHEVYKSLEGKKQQEFLFQECSYLSNDMAFLKNPGFSEEKEVRILRAAVVSNEGTSWNLKDYGGSGERISKKKLPVLFRSAVNGGIISYVEMPLSGLGADLIKKVIIGPRSLNNGAEVSMALSAAGFSGTKIICSKSTYR